AARRLAVGDAGVVVARVAVVAGLDVAAQQAVSARGVEAARGARVGVVVVGVVAALGRLGDAVAAGGHRAVGGAGDAGVGLRGWVAELAQPPHGVVPAGGRAAVGKAVVAVVV